ncbi:hypothetical protein WMY93_024421 [Mugilogobius chulae]|uniref:Uncharacterized protein n=1 Tax=Mugilogobius chulae TaxID=88201 RepID=A0AAW0NC57_9GOBI
MTFEKAVDNNMALWRKHNEQKIKSTECCLRTAYVISKNNLSFKSNHNWWNCNNSMDLTSDALAKHGISEDVLRIRLIGFATDGAAAMMGKYRGAATLLREKINANLTVIHCMNHNQSPKHLRELELTASNLGTQARRIGRVFDVRWLSSSCTSVTALWESYPTLRRDATAVTANTEVDVAVKALRSMRQIDDNIQRRLDDNGIILPQPLSTLPTGHLTRMNASFTEMTSSVYSQDPRC